MQELSVAMLAMLEQMSESAKVPPQKCGHYIRIANATREQVDYANAAMPAVPVLLAEVRRLRAENAELRKRITMTGLAPLDPGNEVGIGLTSPGGDSAASSNVKVGTAMDR